MYYAFDTTAEAAPAIEVFLSGYTQNQGANYDYESKETYRAEFEEFRTMFLLISFLVPYLGYQNLVRQSVAERLREVE